MNDQIRLLDEATQAEFVSMSDGDIEKLRQDLNADKDALEDQAKEIEKLISQLNIAERVKRHGRAA